MAEQKKRYHFSKKIVLIVSFCTVLGAGLALYYHHQRNETTILDFNDIRDTGFILEAFKRDWHWLVEGFDFSPEKMLKHRAPTEKLADRGKSIIKVAYQGKKPIGFVIYYPKSFYKGRLHLIDVEPDFRSKGWSDKLLDYAMKDLIKRGVSKVELVTRTTNYPAQKLYTRYGFKESKRDDGFVYFEYIVPEQNAK
jgi:ribosomal protein S18 acetylase RimI-like enzyme